ncbi:hypothetical protein ACA910_018268 [Epithemia clementina (nom. ined.)]
MSLPEEKHAASAADATMTSSAGATTTAPDAETQEKTDDMKVDEETERGATAAGGATNRSSSQRGPSSESAAAASSKKTDAVVITTTEEQEPPKRKASAPPSDELSSPTPKRQRRSRATKTATTSSSSPAPTVSTRTSQSIRATATAVSTATQKAQPPPAGGEEPEAFLASSSTIVSYMLEEGKVGPSGKIQPTTLRMTLIHRDHPEDENNNNNMIRLQPGDDVMVFQDDDDQEDDADNDDKPKNNDNNQKKKWPPARIHSFSERQGKVFFNAQWFLSKQDIAQFPQSIRWSGSLTRSQLLDEMYENEIVLSNQMDENEIGAILGAARVRCLNDTDDDDDTLSSSDQTGSPTYLCRYQLEVTPQEMRLMPYSDAASLSTNTTGGEGGEEPWTAAAPATTTTTARRTAAQDTREGKSQTAATTTNTRRASITTAGGHEKKTRSGRGINNNSINKTNRHENEGRGEEDGVSEEPVDDGDTNSGSSENFAVSAQNNAIVAEGEGSILRESIEVGPEHQAVVPPFEPNQPPPKSRNPKLVWKRGAFTDEQIAEYLNGVAQHHTAFLDKHRLSATAAYTPLLDAERLERVLQHRPERLTGSSLSTASMLAGEEHRAALRKECDADALLEILMDSGGDVSQAIATATAKIEQITSGAWTLAERARYNEGFRHHQGALRKIAKTLAPLKTMQEVVDYHFRCKIPDQFRQYQEKKREIAVRIVECLEEKRSYQQGNTTTSSSVSSTNMNHYHHHSSVNTSTTADVSALSSSSSSQQRGGGEEGSQQLHSSSSHHPEQQHQQTPQPHWSELSVQEVATYTEARRRKARELMIDVKEQMGPETLAQVVELVRKLNQVYSSGVRQAIFAALDGNAELQNRLVEFLPKDSASATATATLS